MLRWMIGSSLRMRYMVLAIAAAVVLMGVVRVREAPMDVLPEFAPPYVEIQTEALGLSAEEVEQMITVPLEADLLAGVPWLADLSSESVPGLSSIVLTFEPGTDLMRARQMVQERMTQAHALPHVSKPPTMLQPMSSSGRVMIVGLSSQDLSMIDLSVLTHWTIRPRLLGVPGVANVAVWGERDRQLQVQVDPERLRAYGVRLIEIIETTGNALWVSPLTFLEASTPGTGGFIETPRQRLGIRHLLPIRTPQDLGQVPIEEVDQPPHLSEVATVVEDHQPLIGDALVGDGRGLLLVVERFPWTNTVEVTRGVEEALAALQPGLPGVKMDSTIFRPASFIEMAVANLALSLLIGALLLALVIGAFLFDWRTALISLVAIPLALGAAALALNLQGASFNLLTLAGLMIAVGVIVDDAIIDVETMARRLRQARQAGSGKSTANIILETSLEVRGSIIFATLITMLALVPAFLIEGQIGAFFQPLALAYVLAVLASLVVALTVTPTLALFLLASLRSEAPVEHRESPLARRLRRGYERALERTTRRGPLPAYIALAVLVIIGIAVVPFFRQSLLPSFQERDLVVYWDGFPGTSRQEMVRITTQASRELQAIPGVRNVGAHVGRAIMSDQVVGVNSSALWVSIDPAADYAGTVDAVREVVNGYPGLRREVRTYLSEQTKGILAGVSDPIKVRIYGQDLAVLREKAEQVRKELAGIDGLVDLRVALPGEEPSVEIEVDLAAAQRHGIRPGDVRRAAATLLSGIAAGNLFEDQKVFEVVVLGTLATRHSLTSIRELLVNTPGGGYVRLGDVAAVRIVPAVSVIQREGVSRYIDVSAGVQGRDLGAAVRDVEQRLHNVNFPLEYHPELLGHYAERQAADQRLLGFVIAALIGIFLLLQAAFGSWRLALISFVTVALAPVGALVAVLLGGGVLSLATLAGFLAVLGIAARNGILLINHYQRLEQQEGEPFGRGLVLRGARERFAPILMTALATGLAVVPLVIAGAIPGHEFAHPMAVAILGGLVTSTLINLFIVPALYLRFGSSPQPSSGQLPAASGQPLPATTDH